MKSVAKILLYDQADHVLILHRSGTHPYFPHEVDLPGGEIDRGETAAQAVVREVLEETGLVIGLDSVSLAHHRRTLYGRRDNIFTAHLTTVEPAVAISWEHESYAWIDAGQLEDSLDTRDDYMVVVRRHLSAATVNK